MIQEMVANQDDYDLEAPSLRIWHQFDMAQHIGRGVKIGFPIFELSSFTERETHHLKSLDHIIVCSEWARKIVRAQLSIHPDALSVVPLGVDRLVFNEDVGLPQAGWTTFLNTGKWELRKGHDIIMKAFNRAFQPRDRVRLWMMNHNPFLSEAQTNEWVHEYSTGKMSHRVAFLPRVQTHAEVAKVMSEAHCGVFPARAEGWNLELLEMMSMGKHVITTNYSAHTEFCNTTNSRLINISAVEEANDGIWFNGQGRWAQLGNNQVDQLIAHMKAVHEDVQSGKVENAAGIETAKKFTWQASGESLVKAILKAEENNG
jgi:glycosyltransferase involved in cell wall biosynthesis